MMSAVSTPRPRLSARRGSVTAPDPFGVHAEVNLNPNRSSSSKLTIVRVPAVPIPTPPVNLNEPPSSPVLSQRRLHRRIGGQPPTSGPSTSQEQGGSRVSFAFSSFGGGPRSSSPGGTSRDHPPSPSSSPRLRPSSPHLSASTFGGKPRLTPDQLVDLARQATNPRPSPQGSAPISGPSSPGISSHSPVLRPQALAPATPATFTPLPDDIYLPFIDRPAEVSSLISSPPDAKLFTLLAQTFRNKAPADGPSSALALSSEQPVELPRDPIQWSYQQLIYHLTRVDREVAPDFVWAIAARKCILSHSELIWERIKGALGIPPELDVDYDFLNDDQSSPDTSDISDDEGRGPRGHWSDWDATMDSPISTRKRLSMESPVSSLYSARREDHETQFSSQVEEKLQDLKAGLGPSSAEPKTTTSGEATMVPTPHGRGARSPLDQEPGIVIGNFSPPHITHHDASPLDPTSPDYVSIEAILAPSTSNSFSSNPPPLSLPGSLGAGDGLGDIAEGAEEEEEGESATNAAENVAGEGASSAPEDDPNFISPSQIQGLRICTSPVPASNSFGTPPVLSPISPLPPYPPVPTGTGESPSHSQTHTQPQPIPSSASHSRASSFSSIGPFQRSESTGNLAASWSAAAAIAAAASMQEGKGSYYAGSDAGDSSGYISDGDRLPGNPLFPSNFARLGRGPSLRANNPTTRPSQHVPHARYISNAGAPTQGGATPGGQPLASRPRKARAHSHGSFSGLRPASWGAGASGGEAEVAK